MSAETMNLYEAIMVIQQELVDVEIRITSDETTAVIDGIECEMPMGPEETDAFIQSMEWVAAQRKDYSIEPQV